MGARSKKMFKNSRSNNLQSKQSIRTLSSEPLLSILIDKETKNMKNIYLIICQRNWALQEGRENWNIQDMPPLARSLGWLVTQRLTLIVCGRQSRMQLDCQATEICCRSCLSKRRKVVTRASNQDKGRVNQKFQATSQSKLYEFMQVEGKSPQPTNQRTKPRPYSFNQVKMFQRP